MTCPSCEPYRHQQSIRTPQELSNIVKTLREAVASGILTERASPFRPFMELDADGPWDDLIQHELICSTCAKRYLLSCETYRGSGGSWSAVEE